MAKPQYYPFDIKKFPEEDDILLTESDLRRKNVIYCRQEILQQMKCTQWARDEYLTSGLDPKNHTEWFHYHLQKCYTPYMDACGCLFDITDKEVKKMKKEAGPEGWKQLEAKFVQDTAKSIGENKAQMMWEMTTNLKQIHEETRQRDGHLYGEEPKPGAGGDSSSNAQQPRNLAELMGVSDMTNKNKRITKKSQIEVESMFGRAKKEEMKEKMKEAKKEQNKSIWKFGF